MDLIPESLRTVENRLKLLEVGHETVRKDLDISVLDIPEDLRNELLNVGVSTLSRLISHYINPEFKGQKSVFTSSLRYSTIDPEDVDKLASVGVETFLDLFIAPDLLFQDLLGVEPNWAFERFIGFNYRKIAERMEKAFLQLDHIPELSKKSVRTLNDRNYYSLFDLPETLDESLISRNDYKVIKTLKQIVNSPIILFLKGIEDDSLQEKLLKIKERPISSLLDTEDKDLQKFMGKVTSTSLLALVDKGRNMSIIESIRNPEQRILKSVGIFTFQQVAKSNAEDLIVAGIERNRAERMIKELNLPVDTIYGLNEETKSRIKDHGLEKVYQFLDDPRFYDIEFEKSLILKMPTSITDIFSGKEQDYLEKKEISSISSLLKSKSFKKDIANGDEDAIRIAAILHAEIRAISEISDRWYNNLNSIGVKKIWQFYTRDEEEISKAVNVSVTSIIETKNNIKLKASMVVKPEPIVRMSKLNEFIPYGLCKLSDYKKEDIYFDMYQSSKELLKKLIETTERLDRKIWEIPEFWKLPVMERETIAKLGVGEIYTLPGDREEYTTIVNVALNLQEEFSTTFKQIEEVIGEPLPEINGITTFQHWFYLYHGKITPELINDGVMILRRTINRIQGMTPKAVISSKAEGITHLSDLVFMSPEEYSKRIRLPAKNMLSSFKIVEGTNNELYPIGLFPESKLSLMNERFDSWLAIIGNCLENDFYDLKGITKNSFNVMMEVIDTPIRIISPVRNLGLQKIKRLTKLGVRTVADLLIVSRDDLERDLGMDSESLDNFFRSITRAVINKSLSTSDVPMSISRKIRVSDLETLKELGITDIKQVILKDYKISKKHPMAAGLADIERIMAQPIDEIPWDDETINLLKKNKVKLIGEAVFLTDSKLREICGVSNAKLKEFRKKLPRTPGRVVKAQKKSASNKDSSKVKGKKSNKSSPKSSGKVATQKSGVKKSTATKTTNSKKSTTKSNSKKTTTKKTSTKKKTTKKKTTSKKRK